MQALTQPLLPGKSTFTFQMQLLTKPDQTFLKKSRGAFKNPHPCPMQLKNLVQSLAGEVVSISRQP